METPAKPPVLAAALAALGALVLAGLSALLLCRAAGRDGITPVPQLLAFLPWLLVPALGALLASFAARWRTGMAWAALAVGGLCAALLPATGSTAATTPAGTPLRVLSSNVEFGGATVPLLGEIRRHRPDLVFVAECPHACADALRSGLPGYPYRAAVTGKGSAGSVILSRHPLHPTPTVPGDMGMPGALVRFAGHDLRLQLAHPMPPLPGHVARWERELGRLSAAGDQVDVMAGDFNASQDHAAFRDLPHEGRLRDAAVLTGHSRVPTWPARTTPVLGAQIDHVLLGPALTARSVHFPDLPATDHRAVLTDLTLRSGTTTRGDHPDRM